ncbi:hypothetical protein Q8A67_008721 [Cirrhinus molitorella]|uniref:TRIM8/14/16/25/29/45/65 coiled-coil region domain-containing protein n=1 Tax=Cirrhinus molitorella TaxID=172907 RepID=A0AA88TSM7_9TELE|nr:hypothetical protein Q8A67_008721 [Cirrhinus molitorella]
MDEHKNHETVPAAAERTKKERQLEETQRKFHQRIQEKQKELDELREAVESYKSSAQAAVEDNERTFTELIRFIERSRSEVIQLIRDQEKTAVSRAEERLEKLEQEIEDLRRRDTELEQLSYADDHIHFLQSFQSLSTLPGSTDSPSITVRSRLSFDDVATAERTEKQRQLKDTQSKFRQRIQEKQKKLEELRESVESQKRSAQAAVEHSERIFTELIHSIERRRSEVTQLIRDREKSAVSQAEEQKERLEQEIEDLRRRGTELEQLSHTDHHIHFLQSFQSLFVPLGSTDSPSITVSSLFSFDDVEKGGASTIFPLVHAG